MSKRESIAANIVATLTAMTSPVVAKYITREPFEFTELSNAQFPAILVQSSTETREDATRAALTTKSLVTLKLLHWTPHATSWLSRWRTR